MGASHQHLIKEIDRQLSSSIPATEEETHSPPILEAQQQFNYQRYRSNLLSLRTIIVNYLKLETAHSTHLDLPDEALFWQIPAFCDDGPVINQEHSKDRNRALQQLRAAKHNVTDDIWARKELVEWESDTEPSVVLVQGTSQSLERLEKFSVEMTDHLASIHPVVYLLNPLPAAVYDQSVFGGNEVLRQLAVQCLQMISPAVVSNVLDFVADMTCRFRDEKCKDWFPILEAILSHQRQVFIIVNAGILRGRFQDACSWPAGFSRLVQQLQGKTRLKVMIITCRQIKAEVDATTRVIVIGNGPSYMNQWPLRRPYSATAARLSNANALAKDERSLPGRGSCPIDTTPSQPPIQQPILPDVADAADCHLVTATHSNKQYSIDHGHQKSPMPLQSPNQETQSPVGNMQDAELGAFQVASASSYEISAAQWFKKLELTQGVIYPQKGYDLTSYKPIKVAVLDTGFAYTAAEDRKALKPYYERIKKFANFIDGETDAKARTDPSGHGTAVAVQLLKVSLRAVLYICRVVSTGNGDSVPDKSAVERAIRKAAAKPDKEKPGGGGWGVDIINMSFGWPYNHEGVRKAIEFARFNGVHMFASTSNDGLLGPPNDILHPARSPDVIAVDAADGLGEHAGTAPSSSSLHSRETRFSAPGLGLSSPNSAMKWSGSSFACPVAAGIGALILEFARQPPLNRCQTVQDYLREMPAMVAILRRMSSEKGPGELKFLVPWKLIGKIGEERIFTSYFIVDELRKEYGPEVGTEISDYFKTPLLDQCL